MFLRSQARRVDRTIHMQSIGNHIRQQIESNKSKNLLYARVGQIMEIEPGFLFALEQLLASARQDIDVTRQIQFDMVSFAVQALLERLYSVNQYLRIDRAKVQELENIYRQTWQIMLRTGDVHAALREHHYPELSRWIADLYPPGFLESLKLSPFIGHVVCKEYSAQLQIELLGIDVSHIKEPLIDVGCGARANLVRYLRSLDIEAYGLDRSLARADSYLESIDWFDYSFEPDTWGTIVSHLAFANHLVFTYRHDRTQLDQYVLKMRDMIRSLVIGGTFYYAPSLPFIEQRLSAQYEVKRKRVVRDVFASSITRAAS